MASQFVVLVTPLSPSFCVSYLFLKHDGSSLCLLFHLNLSHVLSSSVHSLLCMCCHFWNRRTSSKPPRRVATGASLQKTTCCGERNAGRKVSLRNKMQTAWSMQSRATAELKELVVSRIFRNSAPHSLLTGIDEPLPLKKRKIVKPGFTHSPWKSAYIRQHRIDTNWRRGDLKSPKVAALLKDESPRDNSTEMILTLSHTESQTKGNLNMFKCGVQSRDLSPRS